MTAQALRLFVAVEVGDAVRASAARFSTWMAREQPGAARALRWVDPDHMHLTLRFLGDVQPEAAARLTEAFTRELPVPPAAVSVGRALWLPGGARPRVLVRSIDRGADALAAVKDAVDQRVRTVLTLPAEERAFRPHVTLARVREGQESRARQAALDAPAVAEPIEVGIDRATLYRSVLSPAGPSYSALAVAVLSAAMPT